MADQKILCATDGSPLSEKAVIHAINWAGQLNQPLTFITVTDGSEIKFLTWDETRIGAGELPVDKPLLLALQRALASGLKHVGCVRGTSPDIAEGVVTYAEKNHYHHIIVGSAGRTGTARLLKGSVAEDIVTRAHCPVTIVR
jgi:nucleotide-binding universal stress UspA family protein